MNICPECKANVDIYVAGFCLSCAGKYITQQAKRIAELEDENKQLKETRKCSCGESIFFYTYCERCRELMAS